MRDEEYHSYHFIYGLNNLQHFLITNLPVAIDIIQLECPLKLVVHLPATRHTQRAYELLELDRAIVVSVEHPKHIFCERGRVAMWEEASVDFLEFGFGQESGGTIFNKAYARSAPCQRPSARHHRTFIPLLQLFLVEMC